jgi:hypothetical protein
MNEIDKTNLKKDFSDISTLTAKAQNLSHDIPTILNQLITELQRYSNSNTDLQKRLVDAQALLQTHLDTAQMALNSTEFNPNNTLPLETQSLIKEYIFNKNKLTELEADLNILKKDLNNAETYVKYDVSDSAKVRPEFSENFLKLIENIDNLVDKLRKESENRLYAEISSALSGMNDNQLPEQLMDMINRLVIDRIESMLKPYEELSEDYVSGKITHEEFTESLRKTAFIMHLREKVVSDIARELQNNNLTSPVIPTAIKDAVNHIVRDTKDYQTEVPQIAELKSNNSPDLEISHHNTSSKSFVIED